MYGCMYMCLPMFYFQSIHTLCDTTVKQVEIFLSFIHNKIKIAALLWKTLTCTMAGHMRRTYICTYLNT